MDRDKQEASGSRVPGAQSIDRALDVLACFLDREEMGITELTQRTNLSASTTHRIVQALTVRGYLRQSTASDRYHLGPAAIVLGQAARRTHGLERALPALEDLGQLTGESVNLGLRDGDQVVVVLHVRSPQPLRFDQPVGTRRSLHSTSMGKALLAFAPGPHGPSAGGASGSGTGAGNMLPPVTANTITDPTEFAAHLDEVRRLGYSTDAEESVTGVSCLGAPILNAQGEAIAAIAVQGPTARLSLVDRSLLAKRVLRTAERIAESLELDPFGHLWGQSED